MTDILFNHLSGKHVRLERLLHETEKNKDAIDLKPYAEFRKGLLRHIGIEERIVIPETVRVFGEKAAELAARLRLDHGALVSLMVPTPTREIIAVVRNILADHNEQEEKPRGLCALFEAAAVSHAEEFFAEIRSVPDVPLTPHNDKPGVLDAVRRSVERAGYKLPA